MSAIGCGTDYVDKKYKLIRSRLLVSLRGDAGKGPSVEDGYVFIEDNLIREVVAFSEGIGARLLNL